MARLVWIFIGLVVIGCGGRSSLKSADLRPGIAGGAGGVGGTTTNTTTSTTNTTTSTGDGGTEAFCTPSRATGLRSFDTSSVERASSAQLAQIDDDRVVLSHQEVSDVIGFVPRLGRVTFEAWGSWPAGASLGEAVPLFHATVHGYELARGPGSDFALLAGVNLPSGDNVVAWNAVQEQAAYPDPKLFASSDPDPLFVTRRGASRLYGYTVRPASGVAMMQMATWESLPMGPLPMACATDRLQAAGVLIEGARYLVATSNGRDHDTCFDDDGIDGPARRLQLTRVTADSSLVAYELTWEDAIIDVPVLQVEMEPLDDGAWLVWQRDGGLQPTPVMGLRVDTDGNPVVGPVTLLGDGVVYGGFATTTLQGRLLVGCLDASDPSNSAVQITAFERDGSAHEGAYYQPPLELWLQPPFALLGSPRGGQLLLAFEASGSLPDIDGNAAIYVERLSCE